MLNRFARVAVAVAVTTVFGLVARAQRAGRPDQPPVAPHSNNIDSSYPRMPLPPGAETDGRLNGARMKQFVNEVTGVSRKSRDDGER